MSATTDHPRPSHRRRAAGPLLLAGCLLAVACGGGGGEQAGDPPADGSLGAAPVSGDGGAGGLLGSLVACPDGDEVEDPPASQEPATAVGVDDPDVEGIGDPAVPDLGDPSVDVQHYDLTLRVAAGADGRIDAGVARIRLQTTRATEAVRFDLVGLDVGAVLVDGEAVPARREAAKLVVPLPEPVDAGHELTVQVCYSGTPVQVTSPAIYNADIGWGTASGGTYVLAEPEGSRNWFPANDHPSDKATFAFNVTVPPGMAAVANGRLVGGPVPCTGATAASSAAEEVVDGEPCPPDDDEAAGRRTFRWEMDAPMAPYLATVLVGDYRREAHPPVGGVPVEVWYPAEADGAVVEAFERQSQVMDFLVERLGPYPFDSYGGAVLPGRTPDGFLDGVAFEAQGMSIYGIDAAIEWVVVHEAAHQWFGNSVTLRSWTADLWWVEGFASWAEWLWEEQHDGPEAYLARVERAERRVRSEVDPLGDLDPAALFGPLAYEGGALVFHALRAEVGEDVVFDILRTFLDRHRHGSAGTTDLVRTASEVAGRDLGPFFDAWLATPDRPTAPR